MPTEVPVLRVREVSKSFGEAHALVGENGAGKSTIVKMPAGVRRPDAGTLELDGKPVELNTPADAKAAGIAVIYQSPRGSLS